MLYVLVRNDKGEIELKGFTRDVVYSLDVRL